MEGKEGLEALFQFATEGILIVSEKGEIVRANPAAERLFGYNKGELHAKRIEVLVPKRLSHSHENHRNQFNEHPHARAMGGGIELNGLKKNGSEFPVEISLSPYAYNESKFTIAFIIDVSLRKQAEEKLKNYSVELERQVKNRTLILEEAIHELEKTKSNLNDALEKEKELSELKSRFVSMASHEFRTPLTTMMSSLSLVSKYCEKGEIEKHSKHVGKIKSSINNLTEILNDFLSVSRLEEGKIESIPEEINLKAFTTEVLSEMRLMATSGQQLNFEFSGKETAHVDRKLMKNILFNLISNAIKFSPENGLVDIKIDSQKKEFKLVVSDNGIGIPKEDQKHLFERFFRGNNATNIQGTGLGLNIVLKYLELMKGEIDLKSEENKGTTITITIPQ